MLRGTVPRDDGRGFREPVALVDGHTEGGEELLLFDVEEGPSTHTIEDVLSEDHSFYFIEDQSLRDRVWQERPRSNGKRRPVPAIAVPGNSRGDSRLEQLLDEASLLFDARYDLLHEIARQGGDCHEKVGACLLEVYRNVAKGG